MSGGFKRSSWFGLLGVFVVAALVAAIALTMGQGDPNPKLALGLIFGVLAVFFVLLFALQRADLERVAVGDAAASNRAAAEGGRQVDNPTTLAEGELWGAMATGPIDADAIRAREEMWETGRHSIRLGMAIVLLIFLTVPSIYLFETFLPLLIGGPLIVLAAIYGAVRAIGPGGEIEQSYDRTDRAMKPLGLQVSETPTGGFEMRYPTMPGFDYRLRGWTVMSGERHGRAVTVRLGGYEDAGVSEVGVAGQGGVAWTAHSSDGRIRADEGAPDAALSALRKLPNSVRWSRIEVASGPEGILVSRRKGSQADWLCDLWLAERLASS